MDEPVAVVSVTEQRQGRSVDSEFRVRSLRELYDACRDKTASHIVRVTLRGPDGEVRFNFASFIKRLV
jgi:hypothetical protein